MAVHPPFSDLLTDGQRRHLSASLEHVEMALEEIEALATPGASHKPVVLIHMLRDLPPGFDQEVHAPLARARALIEEIAATFRLHPNHSSAQRTVQTLALSSLVVLEDAFSRRLHGYGDVHPRLPGLLDPALARLHAEMAAVGAALRPHGPGPEFESPDA